MESYEELKKKEKTAASEGDYDLAKKYQDLALTELKNKEKKAAANGDYDLAKKYQSLRVQGTTKIQKKQIQDDDNDIPNLVQRQQVEDDDTDMPNLVQKQHIENVDNDMPNLVQGTPKKEPNLPRRKQKTDNDNDMPVLVPVRPPPKTCAVCSCQKNLFRCSRCKLVYYCSQKHQKKHWRDHKKACSSKTQATKDAKQKPKKIKKGKKEEEKGEEKGDILSQHEQYVERFQKVKYAKGLKHHLTLESSIELMNSYIGLYRLEPCDNLIRDVFPLCKAKGEGEMLHIRAIQCRAFLRYKQHRFQDSLQDFLEFRKLAGPSVELDESIGHSYNALGNYTEAETFFQDSLRQMDTPEADAITKVNMGGVLLGLGIIRIRQDNCRGALKYFNQALELYAERFKHVEHSMIAKIKNSVGNAREKLGQLGKAEDAYREAVRIFKFTFGGSPLTGNSLVNLARCSYAIGTSEKKHSAKVSLLEALEQFVALDSLSIYMKNIIEILTLAKTWADPRADSKVTALENLNAEYAPYVKLLMDCHKNMNEQTDCHKREQNFEEDANSGVFFKNAGEICMLAGEYKKAHSFLHDAIRLLGESQRNIIGLDVSIMIADCKKMLEIDYTEIENKKENKKKEEKEEKEEATADTDADDGDGDSEGEHNENKQQQQYKEETKEIELDDEVD